MDKKDYFKLKPKFYEKYNNCVDLNDAENFYYSDGINPLKYFVYKYKRFPNKLNLDFLSQELQSKIEYCNLTYDINGFIDKIVKKYPNTIVNANSFCNEKCELIKTIFTIIIDEIETIALIDSSDNLGLIVYFNEYKNGKYVFNEFCKSMKLLPQKSHQKKISLVVKGNGGYDLMESEIKDVEVDINKHYNDDFKKADKIITEFIEEDKKSGLVILNGVKGTGKTTYIRRLINNSKRKFIYLTKELANALVDPTFLTFLSENKDCVLLIEDCENLVAARNQGNNSTGISNLLNLCDGLLSDVFNIKIIATFNEDISKVDSALLRKGRLIYRYEFRELSVDKSNKLLKHLKFNHVTDVPMTLSDIFNFEIDNGENSKKYKKIGF